VQIFCLLIANIQYIQIQFCLK